MNKNGEISDILLFVVVLFILAVGFVIISFIIAPITNGLRSAGLNNSIEGTNAINSLDTFPQMINNGFLLLFAGLVISMMITSFMSRSHPIFLIVYILVLIITSILGIYLGNTYYEFIQNNPVFASSYTPTYINAIMNYIVEITIAVDLVSIIILFSRFSTYGGKQQF